MITVTNPLGSAAPDQGAAGYGDNFPVVASDPYQVMGFSPLVSCTDDECRSWSPDCCYCNPVFAELGTRDIYDPLTNDTTSYLINMGNYIAGTGSSMSMLLQKWNTVTHTWSTTASLGTSAYGQYWNFGDLAISTYKGYAIEWRKVLDAFGEGCYRFYATYGVYGREGCLVGECYTLRIYSCALTHGTVRFDSRIFDGSIASIDVDGLRFDLCDILWKDQIRVAGFFGYEETDEEKRQIELTDGKVLKTRDELIQKFTFTSGVLPKSFHDRFKAYGTMADQLRVTDYNWNNSDYLIKLKLIVREGGMKPDYKIGKRNFVCKYTFKEGYQNVSRSLCC